MQISGRGEVENLPPRDALTKPLDPHLYRRRVSISRCRKYATLRPTQHPQSLSTRRHRNEARMKVPYSLVFRQLSVEINRFYSDQLQVLVYDRCPQLVRGKLEAEEERRARFWRHGVGGDGVREGTKNGSEGEENTREGRPSRCGRRRCSWCGMKVGYRLPCPSLLRAVLPITTSTNQTGLFVPCLALSFCLMAGVPTITVFLTQ